MKKNSDREEKVQTLSASSTQTSTTTSINNNKKKNDKSLSIDDSDDLLKNKLDLEERYGIDPDTNMIEGAQVRHPNRPEDKSNGGRRAGAKSSPVRNQRRTNDSNAGNIGAIPEELTKLSRETLIELSNPHGGTCVSIYMPTHQSINGPVTAAGATLFKSLLQQCERAHEGKDATQLASILRPAHELLRNENFWRSQSAVGLAFFIAEDFFKYASLRAAPETQTIVNDFFSVSPLLPFVQDQAHFYLLVISKKQSKLFRGDRFGLNYIPVPEIPNGIEDVVHLEEKDGQNLIRSGSSGGGGGAVYHGTGSSRPDDKDNIAMYLAEVDSTIRKEVLRDSQAPLLLAGVGYLIPIYRKVTHYNNVWDTALTGNREFDNDAALHAGALEAMHDYFERLVD